MDPTKKVCKIIQCALKNGTLEIVLEYLQSMPDATVTFNSKTLSALQKILTNGSKHEDKALPVACVLDCLQYYLDLGIDAETWLPLAETVCRLCEQTFVMAATFIKDNVLTEKCLALVIAITEHCGSIVDDMFRCLLQPLLQVATSYTSYSSACLTVLPTLASLIQCSSRGVRCELFSSLTITKDLEALSNYLLVCGDYEEQITVVEVLARSWIFIKGSENKPSWFSDFPELFNEFIKYKFIQFDPDSRLFLNEVNAKLGDRRLVHSLPCMIVTVDNTRLKKPTDPLYKEFWVDFNLSSRRVSLYYMPNADSSWALFTLEESAVVDVVARNSETQSRNGQVIQAVKIVFNATEPTSSKPQTVSMYFWKNEEFMRVEKTMLMEIFKGKYKSEVTYPEMPCPTEVPPAVNNSASRQSEKALERPRPSGNATFVEVLHQNWSDSPGVVSPTPPPSQTPTAKREPGTHLDLTVTSTTKSEESSPSSGSLTDSFPEYVRELKEKDNLKNLPNQNQSPEIENNVKDKTEQVVETYVPDSDDWDTLFTDSVHNKTRKISNDTKTESKNNSKTGPTAPVHSVNTTSIVSPPLAESNSKMKSPASEHLNSILPHKNEQHEHSLNNISNNSKKRTLYSSNQSDMNAVILSSQDDFSVGIPSAYVDKKQELKRKPFEDTEVRVPELRTKPQQNIDRKNISYSYIKHAQKKTSTNEDHATILACRPVAENDQKMSDSIENRGHFNFKDVHLVKEGPLVSAKTNERKLKLLNQTPENTNKIFPAHSVYSDFSDLKSNDRVKKTYGRPKPKKVRKRIKSVVSSESDLEDILACGPVAGNDKKLGDSSLKDGQLVNEEPLVSSKTNKRKLEPLNKTPENKNKNVPTPSAYSDFSGLKINDRVKKTRGRPKPKKRMKLVSSSESDSEYEPPAKIPQVTTPRQQGKRKGKNSKIESFVDKAPRRVDPIRDKQFDFEMELKNTQDSELALRETDIEPAPESKSKTAYSKNKGKKTVPKKQLPCKSKKDNVAQKGKTRGKKNIEATEVTDDDMEMETGPVLDLMNYDPCQEIEQLMEDNEMALEILGASMSRSEAGSTTFKVNEMLRFGNSCVMQGHKKVAEVIGLAEKQMEMNTATFNYKSQVSSSNLEAQCQKMELVSQNLMKMEALLDATHTMQKDIAEQIQAELVKLNKSRETLISNISDIQKAESSQITAIFKNLGKYTRSLVMSFVQKVTQKALPK